MNQNNTELIQSIAQSLNGKRYDFLDITPGRYSYDIQTMIFTFSDGSKAKLISLQEKSEPYIEFAVTKSWKTYRVWKAL